MPTPKYIDYYIKNNKDYDERFIIWMDDIESKVLTNTGCALLDLPDENYMASFEENVSVNDMVVMINNSFFNMFLY